MSNYKKYKHKITGEEVAAKFFYQPEYHSNDKGSGTTLYHYYEVFISEDKKELMTEKDFNQQYEEIK